MQCSFGKLQGIYPQHIPTATQDCSENNIIIKKPYFSSLYPSTKIGKNKTNSKKRMADVVSRSSLLSDSSSFIGLRRSNAWYDIDVNSVASHCMYLANIKSVSDVASKLWEKAAAFGVDGGDDVDFHVEAIKSLEEKDKISNIKKVANKSGLL